MAVDHPNCKVPDGDADRVRQALKPLIRVAILLETATSVRTIEGLAGTA